MDLNLLLVFEAMVEERNVTRAAQRIGLSQPAMSNALARLRRAFDDPLFLRTAEGMTPTPKAQELMEPIRASLMHLRGLFEKSAAFDPSASDRVFHLLTNDYVELLLLAPLAHLLRAHATRIRLRLQRAQNVFEPPPPNSLVEAHVLAIGFYPDALVLDNRVRSQLLWEEPNVCICRAGHSKVRANLTLRQYVEAEHVAVFYKKQGPGVIDTLLAQKGHARRTAIVTPHFTSIPFLVAETDFIATVPERLARRFSGPLNLKIYPVPIEIPPLRLTLLWHERFQADPAHIWLRERIAVVSSQ